MSDSLDSDETQNRLVFMRTRAVRQYDNTEHFKIDMISGCEPVLIYFNHVMQYY